MGRVLKSSSSIVAMIVGMLCVFLIGLTSAHPVSGTPRPVTVSTWNKLTTRNCEGVNLKGKFYEATFNETLDPSGKIALLHKGTYVGIDFKFSANVDEQKLTSKVYGSASGLPYVGFPLKNPDGCKDSGIQCPIKAGSTQNLQSTLQIESWFPQVNVVVKWELLDQNDNAVFCVEIPARVEK